MTPLVTPTIHNNGTSAQELVEQRIAVMEAARELLRAMQAATPHGRDYPQGNHGPAHDAWWDRMMQVESLISELEMDAMKITLEACKS